MGLCEEKIVEFRHETVVERGEIFQAVGARLFQAAKEEDLMARIELLEKLPEFRHRETASRDTQHVMNETFDKLLRDIITGDISVGKLAGCEEFVKGNGLRGKRDRTRRGTGHSSFANSTFAHSTERSGGRQGT